ncbi:MAG: hypothetical protein DI556_09885 [Rhodovulum sulfidophilum]|uniref:Addiction module toxin RelE n=1 Tax=Rhodovulum sulfidophilum TaxID=35806 RepID=A0A2W5N8I8_RHOSU|nr:MAG: hypothetical protein DI556_09885 [Rhodovulum sulfidophilum]
MKIVRTRTYLKDLKRMRVSDAERDALEVAIASNPEEGDTMVGLKGVRKIRFAMGNRGKSGGGRAVYYVMISDDAAIMLHAYAKNEKSDLSGGDRKALLAILKELTDG